MTYNRFKRRSINLDDASHQQCKALADDLGISISGLLRLIIRQTYEQHPPTIVFKKQDIGQSCLQP